MRPRSGSVVDGIQLCMRDDFAGTALNNAVWEVRKTGAGQAVAVASSALTITSGTTINAETVLRTVFPMRMPFRVGLAAKLS